jgi:hypothetical protein
MTIAQNLTEFVRFPVEDYDGKTGILHPQSSACRVKLTYAEVDTGATILDRFQKMLADPAAPFLQALVIGAWASEVDTSSEEIVQAIAAASGRLSDLWALFIGDITFEESEMSWIEQSDVSPILAAYPRLEHFRVRGGNNLGLGRLDHQCLRELVIETGGMDASVVAEVAAANLPALEHLELWLGDDGYGATATVDDLKPILQEGRFPKLRYLGLRNSYIEDEVAVAVARAPVLKQLETLDLSLGTLSDSGAAALVDSPQVRSLKRLDLHHHFMSDEMMARISKIGIDVDISDKQKVDEDDYRFVAVGE